MTNEKTKETINQTRTYSPLCPKCGYVNPPHTAHQLSCDRCFEQKIELIAPVTRSGKTSGVSGV